MRCVIAACVVAMAVDVARLYPHVVNVSTSGSNFVVLRRFLDVGPWDNPRNYTMCQLRWICSWSAFGVPEPNFFLVRFCRVYEHTSI